MTEKKLTDEQVEQWVKDAGEAISDEVVNPTSDDGWVRASTYAEIIARHCPYSSAAIEELVRVAATIRRLRWSMTSGSDSLWKELSNALTALGKERP